MAKKAPRRTAQRILETGLDLFNRFGEPNVSTTLIASELGISPGNLYYHYPAKDALINRLHEAYEHELGEVLLGAQGVRDIEAADVFLQRLFELIWRYRFLYRDLNDLLSKNRHLETRFQQVLRSKETAVRTMLGRMAEAGHLSIDPTDADLLARSMVVLVTYWLSYEYVGNPREALEPEHAQQSLVRGSRHTLQLLTPYLAPAQQRHLLTLGTMDAGEDAALTA